MSVYDVFFDIRTSLLIFEAQQLHWSVVHRGLALECHRGDPNMNRANHFYEHNETKSTYSFPCIIPFTYSIEIQFLPHTFTFLEFHNCSLKILCLICFALTCTCLCSCSLFTFVLACDAVCACS